MDVVSNHGSTALPALCCVRVGSSLLATSGRMPPLPLALEETFGHSDRPNPWVFSVTSTGLPKTVLHLTLSAQPLCITIHVSPKSNTSDAHSQAYLSMLHDLVDYFSTVRLFHRWLTLCLRRLSHMPANAGPWTVSHRVCRLREHVEPI